VVSDRTGAGARGLQLGMYTLPVALALSFMAWAWSSRVKPTPRAQP